MTTRTESYTSDRPDVRKLVPSDALRILDVGCSNGILGGQLKRAHPERYVAGIELDATLANIAEEQLDLVLLGDAMEELAKLVKDGARFDVVIMADILEHLIDPWKAVHLTSSLLDENGCVIVSVPNVAHWTTIASLLAGKWPRRDRGIHDRTHLHFFTIRDLPDLIQPTIFCIDEIQRNYRVFDRPSRLDRLAPVLGKVWPAGFTYQLVVRSRQFQSPSGRPKSKPPSL